MHPARGLASCVWLRRASRRPAARHGAARLQPTTCRRIFLAALGGGEDLSAGAAAAPRGTNTVERSSGTGKKKARCRRQQRFLLLLPGATGFRGAGGHTVAGRSRHGDAVGVTHAAESMSSRPPPRPRRGRRELAAVGVTQPVSAASGPSPAAAVWTGRSTAKSERSSSTPIGWVI
uniref:Uncharacterized protein n=1 Tax=Zea mays TaxID=4577 RepID=C0HHS4_MAIZE|nr:unknown [Zea mays]